MIARCATTRGMTSTTGAAQPSPPEAERVSAASNGGGHWSSRRRVCTSLAMPKAVRGHVRAGDLAVLLRLPLSTLLARLDAACVPLRRGQGRDALLAWADLEPVVTPAEAKVLRGSARTLGFRIKTSTWTLAGYPRLVAEWHPAKNRRKTPWDVPCRSNKLLWWKCPAGPDHEWAAKASDRSLGGGCPYCAGRLASVTNSLATTFPAVAAQWHETKNGRLTPDQVAAGTQQAAWWKCAAGHDHEWPAQVASRTRIGTGCPFCAGVRASSTSSLAAVAPDVARQWHSVKNGTTTPADVTAGTPKKYWWRCAAGHEWRAQVRTRVRCGYGCPVCARARAKRPRHP